MNKNVGASFGLSVLTVIFFAVVLYQPDRSPAPPGAGVVAAPVETVEARPPVEAPEPVFTRAVLPDPVETSRRVLTPAAKQVSAARPVAVAPKVKPAADERAPAVALTRPVSRRATPPVMKPEPRTAFTQARTGESLEDVASRVYGSSDAAKTLWLSNRDILDRADGPIRPGTLLRTP